MKDTVLILFAQPWKMSEDRQTGEKLEEPIEGTTLFYLSSASYGIQTDLRKGCRPSKESAPRSFFDDLTAVPGYYEVDFAATVLSSGDNGKTQTVLRPRSAVLIEEFDLDVALNGVEAAR